MTRIRQLPSIAARGFAPARIGMHCGFDMQARGNLPVSGGRLAT